MDLDITSRRGEDIATEIIMMKQTTSGPFLIVEGPTDERFLKPRVKNSCYVAIGSGRITVERAVELLDAASPTIRNVLGVVDEDYDWLIGYSVQSANIVKTDPRDLEGLLFQYNDLTPVLVEYADREACSSFERLEGRSIRDAVLARAEPFGRIRMVNALGPQVDMKKFKPIRFFGQDWTYDLDEAKRVAVTIGVSTSVPTLESQMAALQIPDLWHCARGHDLVDIFVGGLISVLGARSADKLGVERLLRQSLSSAQFSQSLLFSRIDGWSAANVAVLKR